MHAAMMRASMKEIAFEFEFSLYIRVWDAYKAEKLNNDYA